jgi:hypothetical protein
MQWKLKGDWHGAGRTSWSRQPRLAAIGLFPFLFFFGMAFPVTAQEGRFAIVVEANREKAGGQPWDGPGGVILGPFLPNVAGPPDLVACIFGEDGSRRCLTDRRNPNESACHDSFDCDWDDISLPVGDFGIVIIDLDVQQNDFVDAVVFVERRGGRRDESADRIEEAMRGFIVATAPAFFKGETQRRQRSFQRMERSVCESEPCRLRQSRIAIERYQR